jgi:hypothetical protein
MLEPVLRRPEVTDRVVKRHPVRGGMSGLCLGLSLAIALVVRNTIAIDRGGLVEIGAVVVVGIVVGVVWAFVAPTRPASKAAAVRTAPPTSSAPVARS